MTSLFPLQVTFIINKIDNNSNITTIPTNNNVNKNTVNRFRI